MIRNALNQSTITEYNAQYLPIKVTDALGAGYGHGL